MSSRLWTVVGVCAFGIAASCVIYAAPDEAVPVRETMSFKSLQTRNGPVVEITVGDMTFRASRVEFVQPAKPRPAMVHGDGDSVVVQYGKSRISGRRIIVPLRGGNFGKDLTGVGTMRIDATMDASGLE